jgi:hypothetical protein
MFRFSNCATKDNPYRTPFHMSHLGSDGHLCMIFRCYLDDSKDWKQEKVSVCAGFLGNKERWSSLTGTWNECLKRHRIDYFKTSEYKMMKGQFEQFRALDKPKGREKAQLIKNELQHIVKNHRRVIAGVGVAVNIQAYRKVQSRPEAQGILDPNPYHRALESVMFQVCKRVRIDLKARDLVAFVHDDGDDFPELFTLYKDFRRKNPKTAKIMVGFAPLNDRLVPALQMADMVANDIQRNAVRYLKEGQLNKDDFEMHENMIHAGIWNEEYMLNVLKRSLVLAGKAIPQDLESHTG